MRLIVDIQTERITKGQATMKRYWFIAILLGSIGCLSPAPRVEPESNATGIDVVAQAFNSKFLFQDPSADQIISQPAGTNLLVNRLNGIRMADQFPGSNAGEKIAAAIADLPSNGGVVDARGIIGAQTVSADFFAGHIGVALLLGNATYTTSATIVVPDKSRIVGIGRGDAGAWGTVLRAASTLPIDSYVVKLGGPNLAFGTRIENLTVDCNTVAGCGGVYSDTINEQSGLRNVLVVNYVTKGIFVTAVNGAQNYFMEDLEVVPAATASPTAIGIHLSRSYFQSVSRVTVNGATDGFANCGKGIYLDNASGFLSGLHVERCAIEVDIAASGVVISNLSVGPFGIVGVHIQNGFQNIFLSGLGVGGGPATFTLLSDPQNSVSLSAADLPALGSYAVGDGTIKTILSSSVMVNSRMNNLTLIGPTPVAPPGQVAIGATLAPTAGTLAGYLTINIGGTNYKLPYYHN